MRWREIIEEVNRDLKQVLIDLLIPLKDKGIDRVTVRQLLDSLSRHPDTAGLDYDDDYLAGVLRDTGMVDRVEDDPQTNLLTGFFHPETPNSEVEDTEEKVDGKVLRQAKKKTKTV